ncbi:MAG: MMPL family transporter [Thermoleophilaceae bacterium]
MLTALTDRIAIRPKVTLFAVLAFVVIAAVLGGPVAGLLREEGGFTAENSGSAVAVERIEGATGRQASPGIVVLLKTPQGAGAPGAKTRVAALERELSAEPGITSVASLASTRDERFAASDGRSTYLAATLDADAEEAEVGAAVLERYADASDVEVGGSVIADEQIGGAVGADLGRAEALAFPILLILSLLFFRGGRAALIPLGVAVATVMGTFLALRGVNSVYGLSVFALNLVIGLGIGLAIDYALFLLTRYREELAEHGPGATAIRRTMATAGRTVAFSAATVAVALATLVVFPLNFLQSMGIAGAVVSLVAAAATLVLAPALFAVWGTKLAVKPRRRGERPAEAGRWYRLSHAVMRRPGAVAIATGLVMVVVALPSLRAQFTPVDSTVIPKGQSARTVADALQTDYAGQETTPTTVVLDAPRGDAAPIAAYAKDLRGLDGVRSVSAPQPLDASTWKIDVAVTGRPEGKAAQAVVEDVRSADSGVLVGGAAAEFVDQQDSIASRLPLAIGLLALLTFSILWLMTGSVVLPLKALLMNALTVGSSLGVLVLVFQDGRFADLLSYTPNGGIEPTDFLVAAALVFALSTDYGVFLLGRIKEARSVGRSEREAVAVGLERTGAVVTAAAILLAVAIGAFITSSISFIQQIGVATAAGVLIDAFVVRALLVPALMGLLGSWNWWSPAPLRRLHDRIGVSEEPPAPTAARALAVPTISQEAAS